MKELSNEELDRIAAEEVMGWVFTPKGSTGSEQWRTRNALGGTDYAGRTADWHPCTDRNQSRLVVEAAIQATDAVEVGSQLWDSLKYYDILLTTPRQEVEAAILAVRATKPGADACHSPRAAEAPDLRGKC